MCAKVKFSAWLSDVRNKHNGSVFSKNRAGNYIRNKVTPVNPNTSYQAAVRSRLTSLAQGWRSLSQSARDAWNGAVENYKTTDIFGDLKTPTGLALYIRLNSNILNAGGSAITSPPVPTGSDALTTLSATVSTGLGGVAVTFAPTPVPADHALVIESTAPLSAGINNANSQFRVVHVEAATGTSPLTITSAYATKFGAYAVGQKIFFRAKLVRITTGEVSLNLVTSAIVTA